MPRHSKYTAQNTANSSSPSDPNPYFHHPDHLGSASYVTDATGELYQHLGYFAFGETFVEEHSNTDKTPYLFKGKELDEETGLYYYGARYYDPRTSIFPSVDPMADKYPTISLYAYAFNNSLRYIDPTGMEGKEPEERVIELQEVVVTAVRIPEKPLSTEPLKQMAITNAVIRFNLSRIN